MNNVKLHSYFFLTQKAALTPCLVCGKARSTRVDSTRASSPQSTVHTLVVGSPVMPMFPHTRPIDVKICVNMFRRQFHFSSLAFSPTVFELELKEMFERI